MLLEFHDSLIILLDRQDVCKNKQINTNDPFFRVLHIFVVQNVNSSNK
jgi:hypothetical protein